MDYKESILQNYFRYEGLTSIVKSTVERLIQVKNLDYLSVTSRTKDIESIVEKVKRKGYKDPLSELDDICGIRVILYTESDVEKVSQIIKQTFRNHEDRSIDKSNNLGIDKIGYRSIHLVCDLGATREKLPEYGAYSNLLFEVQIRTVLQHAWAEIEHDRNYKFSGVLPNHLARRLHLAAGTLEMVDKEFDSLANEIEKYINNVREETKKGNLDILINTKSLTEYLHTKIPKLWNLSYGYADDKFMIELEKFGLKTLEDLDQILTPDFLKTLIKYEPKNSDVGLVRDAMIYADFDKYFAKSWENNWNGVGTNAVRLYSSKYGEDFVRNKLSVLDIEISDNDD